MEEGARRRRCHGRLRRQQERYIGLKTLGWASVDVAMGGGSDDEVQRRELGGRRWLQTPLSRW